MVARSGSPRCLQYERLTGVCVLRVMSQAIEDSGSQLIEMFKSKPKNEEIKTVLSTEEERAAFVVKLILAHFKEDTKGLLLHADVSICKT